MLGLSLAGGVTGVKWREKPERAIFNVANILLVDAAAHSGDPLHPDLVKGKGVVPTQVVSWAVLSRLRRKKA